MYVAIMKWDADGRVSKYQPFEIEAEATAHAARFADDFPQAFGVLAPAGDARDWIADPVAKTLAVSPLPVLPPPPDPNDELDAALATLDPATATVGDLIAVLRGQRGKGRIAGRPV